MAQFITDIFAQLDKKRALLSAGTKEKRDTVTVNWGGMLYNKRVFLLRSVILCLFVSFLFSVACTACGEAAVPFVRIDRDKLNGWKGKLANVRLLADHRYQFKKVNPKYRFDPDFKPSTEGLDTLCISGSAQFSGRSSGGLLLSYGNAPRAGTYMLLICDRKAMFLLTRESPSPGTGLTTGQMKE